MHQTVHELRENLRTREHPFSVVWERHGVIYLKAQAPLTLERTSEFDRPGDSLLEARAFDLSKKLSLKFGNTEFKSSDLEGHVRLPARSLQRYLKALTDSGHLERLGGGRSVRYKLRARK